jgi:hypothetical protein
LVDGFGNSSFHADDDFAGLGASLFEVGQGFAGLVEVEDGAHDRPDDPGGFGAGWICSGCADR